MTDNPVCHICNSSCEPFISFGQMPIANGFVTPDQFDQEYSFELAVGFCPTCYMVQLMQQPEPERMFHDEYAFFSSTSLRMQQHFKHFADAVIKDYLVDDDPFVVELGSNDGIMLQNFASAGIRHLGVEPSENVAQVAKDKGIVTVSSFFDEKLAEDILKEHGPVDCLMSANVMCHIPNLHSVFGGVHKLLKAKGVLIFEDPYLGDIVEKTSYDQIYDEHAYYFSVSSVSYLANKHDLEVVNVQPQNVHGGSMRYTIAHKGARDVGATVFDQQAKEKQLGLTSLKTFTQLCQKIESSKEKLVCLLMDLKTRGKRVVGYAATSKSTTVINYCGITSDLLEFISDTTPIKQGKYSPGAHIPIKPHDEFTSNYPDYALLFGWNHAQEIMAKEDDFLKAGGNWIVYVPEVKVL